MQIKRIKNKNQLFYSMLMIDKKDNYQKIINNVNNAIKENNINIYIENNIKIDSNNIFLALEISNKKHIAKLKRVLKNNFNYILYIDTNN